MIGWLKRIFRKKPVRQITAAEISAAIERSQVRMNDELMKSYFAPSPLYDRLLREAKEGDQPWKRS